MRTLEYDALVIGSGGAGLRAALELKELGCSVIVATKVFPTRSHTVAAQGGITCAIASADEHDDWRWHMYDTVKGSDYIGDQEAIEYMCEKGPESVYEMERMGLPFSRTETGRIYQRPFGGQSKDYGKGGQAARTCAAADKTGHALLHTLHQGNLKVGTEFLNEWFALDLVLDDKQQVVGATVMSIETAEVVYVKAKATVMATGGNAQLLGGIDIFVNNKKINIHDTSWYRGMMFSGLPNLFAHAGYINFSWTARCEIVSERICKTIKYMKKKELSTCTAKYLGEKSKPSIQANYVLRAMDKFPNRTYKFYQNYFVEYLIFKLSKVNDGALEFKK